MEPHALYVDLLKAATFAAEKHKKQRRKDAGQTPYINHPLGVAEIIVEVGRVDHFETLQAAILHDVLEDTDTTREEIEKLFGKRVAAIVCEVTDDRSKNKAERKQAQVEHASSISYEAKLVKLADKFYNLQDLVKQQPPQWSLKIVQGYFVWSRAVVLRMRGTNRYLEDALEDIFQGSFTFRDNHCYPCIPQEDADKLLSEYYASCAACIE